MLTHKLLLCSSDQSRVAAVLAELEVHGVRTAWRGSAGEGLKALETDDFNCVFVADQLPGDSLRFIQDVRRARPETHIAFLVDNLDFQTVVKALRHGATDVVFLPLSTAEALGSLERSQKHNDARSEVRHLRQVLADSRGFEDLIGASQPMQRMYDVLERAAETDASVLITGESGTGKELVAKALHDRSRRKEGPFVAVNCSALPEALLESELFGHVKGAFTDAKVGRSGLFVQANGGTLLLDEIGEMPIALQPKLLRALQERRVRAVGSDSEVPFNARIIASTNRNLEIETVEKRFREDLFYRINVIHVEVPALRERGADIVILAEHYASHFATQLEKTVLGVSKKATEKLVHYDWPGNVRELQNCIERAVAMTRTDEIQEEDLPEKIRNFRRSHVLVVSNTPQELVSLDEVERLYIARVLKAVTGNKREAARILGIDRKTLYRKLEKYRIV